MRMALDTNVLVSELITAGGLPDQLLQHWEVGDFTLVTSTEQLDEVERVLQYEKLQRFIRQDQAKRLLVNLRRFASFAERLPYVDASRDANDNVILATAIGGSASHLVTDDKADLLGLRQVQGIVIISVREAITLLASQSRAE
jgi:putative PIN family toxin of toxin-antitoxin system